VSTLWSKIQRQVSSRTADVLYKIAGLSTDYKMRSAFDSHCDRHTSIQAQLHRPTGRTYGARYEKKPTNTSASFSTIEAVPTSPVLEPVNSTSLGASTATRNVAGNQATNPRTLSSFMRNSDTAPEVGVDPRLQEILQSYPPYEADSVEKADNPCPCFECPDCDFTFSSAYVNLTASQILWLASHFFFQTNHNIGRSAMTTVFRDIAGEMILWDMLCIWMCKVLVLPLT
jgi:hypothetical protein